MCSSLAGQCPLERPADWMVVIQRLLMFSATERVRLAFYACQVSDCTQESKQFMQNSIGALAVGKCKCREVLIVC